MDQAQLEKVMATVHTLLRTQLHRRLGVLDLLAPFRLTF